MNRKVLLAGAVVAAFAAALLLLPSGRQAKHPKNAEDVSAAADVKNAETEIKADNPIAQAKRAAAEEARSRRATPYYQHAAKASRYWQRLAQVIHPKGDKERETRARELVRQLIDASKPDGTDDMKNEALKQEEALIREFRPVCKEGEQAQLLDDIEEMYAAVMAGEPPPQTPALGQQGQEPAPEQQRPQGQP
jgi:hypothetical protein